MGNIMLPKDMGRFNFEIPQSTLDSIDADKREQRRKQKFNFWVPVLISISAFLVSCVALCLQYISMPHLPPPVLQQPIKQHSLTIDSPKNQNPKVKPIQK